MWHYLNCRFLSFHWCWTKSYNTFLFRVMRFILLLWAVDFMFLLSAWLLEVRDLNILIYTLKQWHAVRFTASETLMSSVRFIEPYRLTYSPFDLATVKACCLKFLFKIFLPFTNSSIEKRTKIVIPCAAPSEETHG